MGPNGSIGANFAAGFPVMSQSAPISVPSAALGRVFAPFAIQPGRGHILDELMAMGVFVILPLGFPTAQPLRAPFTLLLILWLVANWRSILPLIWRGRYLFALPALCLVSSVWADNSMAALRYGTLIGLAMTVGAGIAARLDARQVAVAVLLSQGALAVASALTMTKIWIGGAEGGLALVGVFPHKNILAQRMVFLALAGLAVAFSAGYRPVFRVAALGGLMLALFLITQTISATAVILLAGALPLGLVLAVLWRPAVQVRGMRPAMLFGGTAALVLGLLVLTNLFGISPIEDGLDAFGKDKSLTGRTVIWAAGNEAIAEHPLLGVGAGNFWLADNFAAVRLADRFYSADGAFRFHNAYYEVIVHLGLIGLLVALYVYLRGVLLVVSAWWRNQQGADIFFLLLIAVVFVRSFTESELFYALALGPILFWTATFNGVSEKPEAGPQA